MFTLVDYFTNLASGGGCIDPCWVAYGLYSEALDLQCTLYNYAMIQVNNMNNGRDIKPIDTSLIQQNCSANGLTV